MKLNEVSQRSFQNKLREITKEVMEENGVRTPYEVNDGYCEEWGIEVEETFPGSEMVDAMQIDDNADPSLYGGHVFIMYRGRYYDAETLEGVDDYRDLPIFQKRRHKRR